MKNNIEQLLLKSPPKGLHPLLPMKIPPLFGYKFAVLVYNILFLKNL